MNDPEGTKVRHIDGRILGDETGRNTENTWTAGVDVTETAKDVAKTVAIELLAQVVLKVLLPVAAFLLGLFSGGFGFG